MNNKNHMRTTLKHTLAACIALGALMLSGTACTQDDPLGGNPTAGTQLLQLGKVTIAGTTTATRSTDATTRADAPGYTGIRKTSFVKNDALVLTLKDNQGATIGSTITATLSEDGTTWTLPKTYFTAGTTVSATHTPTAPTAPTGITTYGDDLVTTQPVELKADGTPLTLTLTHANAMVEVTPPAGITGYENLTVSATPPAPAGGGAATTEVLATNEEGTSADLRHRTIAKVGSTLNSVSLTVNTVVYTAPIDPAVVVAANKRYPITLTMSAEEGLTATVAADTNWDDGGDVNGYPTGYDYYISTPEDLMWFASKVNNKTATTATALQTADIDMTGIRSWKQIGIDKDYPFSGSYNGNGYSIKNLKIDGSSMLGTTHHIGLFGYIVGAKITGIHLRDCAVSFSGGGSVYAGALVGRAEDGCIVTLCSATGSVTVTGAQYAFAGGLVGYATDNSSTPNHFTRCTTDVAVTTSASADGYTCGFTGYTYDGHYAGCIASGKVTVNGKGVSSGFSHANSNTYPYHAIGCITNSEIEGGTGQTAFGQINTIQSCLATGSTYTFLFTGTPNTTIANVYLKTMGTGNQPNATDDSAYGILTTSNPANKTMMKTLHYSKAKGYTTTVVDIHHWYANGIWKNNGAKRPTIDMSYEGNPIPIAGANKVYRVNGYFVMAPGGETAEYQWNATTTATTMASDPCKGNANWSMPTMKDFEAMAGWETDYPWSESAGAGDTYIRDVADADAFLAAFPADNGLYWSSTPLTSSIVAWGLATKGTQAYYSRTNKVNYCLVRCVQKQAFPTP